MYRTQRAWRALYVLYILSMAVIAIDITISATVPSSFVSNRIFFFFNVSLISYAD